MSDLPERLRAMAAEWNDPMCSEHPVHPLLLEAANVIEVLLLDVARKSAAHPLVMDPTTGLARFATQDDIGRLELIAHKYERLRAQLQEFDG